MCDPSSRVRCCSTVCDSFHLRWDGDREFAGRRQLYNSTTLSLPLVDQCILEQSHTQKRRFLSTSQSRAHDDDIQEILASEVDRY